MVRETEPVLTIIVYDGPYQLVLLQHWEMFQGFGLSQDVATLQAVDPSHQVIHLYSCPVVRQLPPSVIKTAYV